MGGLFARGAALCFLDMRKDGRASMAATAFIVGAA
jgi:hypothetical protein